MIITHDFLSNQLQELPETYDIFEEDQIEARRKVFMHWLNETLDHLKHDNLLWEHSQNEKFLEMEKDNVRPNKIQRPRPYAKGRPGDWRKR